MTSSTDAAGLQRTATGSYTLYRPRLCACPVGFRTKRYSILPAVAWQAETVVAERSSGAAMTMTSAASGRQIGSECLIMPDTRPRSTHCAGPLPAQGAVAVLPEGANNPPPPDQLANASSFLVRRRQNWNICAHGRRCGGQASAANSRRFGAFPSAAPGSVLCRTVTAGDGHGGLMAVTFWLLRPSVVTATAAR
jgi:hypothetical protein